MVLPLKALTSWLPQRMFDPQLDQFNLTSRATHISRHNLQRAISTSVLFQENYSDSAIHDLSVNGSQELNAWIQTDSNMYLYSYSSFATTPRRDQMGQRPIMSISPWFYYSSWLIGSRSTLQKFGLSEEWEKNDGIVSSHSMKAPTTAFLEYDGFSVPGTWQHMPELKFYVSNKTYLGEH